MDRDPTAAARLWVRVIARARAGVRVGLGLGLGLGLGVRARVRVSVRYGLGLEAQPWLAPEEGAACRFASRPPAPPLVAVPPARTCERHGYGCRRSLVATPGARVWTRLEL